LSTNLIAKKYSSINSPFGYGEVLQTGYSDTAFLVAKYKEYLIKQQLYVEEAFDYSLLQEESNCIRYKSMQARHIVFAEGFGMHANPYFSELPLDGTKGELLVIKAPLLDLDVILNTSVFIIPLGNNIFKVGATYNWADKTDTPTEEGKAELIEKLKEIISCDFEIVEHLAGVRPTVKDRKPLIGTYSGHNSIHILNGLGTRGLMLGPAMAKALFENIEYQKPLDKTVDIKRFTKK
jgi:glycine oxidase